MKKIILFFILYLIPRSAYAAPIVPVKPPPPSACIFAVPGYQVTNPLGNTFCNLADIINKLLPYAFTLAGIILFLLLLASGFEFLTSAGDEKKLQQAKGRITAALAGFIVIICAYWLTQIVEFLFHIKIF